MVQHALRDHATESPNFAIVFLSEAEGTRRFCDLVLNTSSDPTRSVYVKKGVVKQSQPPSEPNAHPDRGRFEQACNNTIPEVGGAVHSKPIISSPQNARQNQQLSLVQPRCTKSYTPSQLLFAYTKSPKEVVTAALYNICGTANWRKPHLRHFSQQGHQHHGRAGRDISLQKGSPHLRLAGQGSFCVCLQEMVGPASLASCVRSRSSGSATLFARLMWVSKSPHHQNRGRVHARAITSTSSPGVSCDTCMFTILQSATVCIICSLISEHDLCSAYLTCTVIYNGSVENTHHDAHKPDLPSQQKPHGSWGASAQILSGSSGSVARGAPPNPSNMVGCGRCLSQLRQSDLRSQFSHAGVGTGAIDFI